MKPFAKLRGRMSEMDIDGNSIANFLGKSPCYVSNRLTMRYSWELNDIYRVMDFLKIPYAEIFTYFPPNGGLPVKGDRHAS